VLGTQIVATLTAVFGFGLMTPLGWGWAAFVWCYALAWFLLNDRVKLLAYRIFDPAKAEPKPDAKAETPSDLTAQIAKRAHELYEERVQGVQDWNKAEQEIKEHQHH